MLTNSALEKLPENTLKAKKLLSKVDGKQYNTITEALAEEATYQAYLSEKNGDPEFSAFELNMLKMGLSKMSTVGNFAINDTGRLLLAEVVNKSIQQAMTVKSAFLNLDDLITHEMTVPFSTQHGYKGGFSDESKVNIELVTDESPLPTYVIRKSQSAIPVKHYGLVVAAGKMVLKEMPVFYLMQNAMKVGLKIRNKMVESALTVLVNGTGNNDAAQTSAIAVANTLATSDIMTLVLSHNEMNPSQLLVATEAAFLDTYNLPEFKDYLAWSFLNKGTSLTPFDTPLKKVTKEQLGGAAVESIGSINKDNGLIHYKLGGGNYIMTDYLLETDLEKISVNIHAGFDKLDPSSMMIKTYS